MDRATLTAERDRVAARVASLRHELASLAEEQALTSHDDEHDPEGVTIAVQRAQLQGLLAAAERERDDLDRAVDRLASGAYGTCGECGGPIAPERLAALPAATTCIACASRPRRRRTAR
ncbi:TraR/DksA family transcriptional regulator [Pseudonocardia sp. C8]|uniref:TraR/DksA family transcriptional regulator n=1 Tax=Pseudonocardia sp. C8 TaxID=2762759 RepID=UPI00164286AF|nr:TraR/DksA C4-type zinc finger protein [Pseudonocardia sp. C8]MBC3189811.1 TraR/DksA family transcriptional regulator [Pseudonocardia sp. C8]